MDDDVLGIRLLPAWDSPSIHAELESTLSRSEFLQAGIAFWTVNDNMFGTSLTRALSHGSGFVCVDMHPPTDIDALCLLAERHAHVRMYCEEIPTYTDRGRREPPCLLHTKMLLFWSKDRTADLWVGSHNWTNRAILGLNVEASLVIRVRDSSGLFSDAAGYLEHIRAISDVFDPSKADFYKQMQRKLSETTTPVIELEAEDAETLGDVTVTLFGTDIDDLGELGTVREDVYVSLSDSRSNQEYLYPATILQSGLLSAYDPSAGEISFSPRRYAFRQGRRFPIVRPHGPIETDVRRDAGYFAALRLAGLDSAVTAEPVPPKTAAWEPMSEDVSPLLRRLDSNARTLLFRGKEPRVKRPRIESDTSEALTLAERKHLTERTLVTRRILRPKSR